MSSRLASAFLLMPTVRSKLGEFISEIAERVPLYKNDTLSRTRREALPDFGPTVAGIFRGNVTSHRKGGFCALVSGNSAARLK